MNSTQDIMNEKNYIQREIKEIRGKNNLISENIEILENLTEIHEIKEFSKKYLEKQNFSNHKKLNHEFEIRLEGEPAIKNIECNKYIENSELDNLRPNCKNTDLCPNCKNTNLSPNCKNINLCPSCENNNLCPNCKNNTLYPNCKNQDLYQDCENKDVFPDCINEELNKEILCPNCKNESSVKCDNDKMKQNEIVEEQILEDKNENNISENEKISNLIENIFERIKCDSSLNDCSDLKVAFQALNENEKNEVIEGVKIKIDKEEQENKFNDLLKLLC